MVTSTVVTRLLIFKSGMPLIPEDPKIVKLAFFRGILGCKIQKKILISLAISFLILTISVLHIPVPQYAVIGALNTPWVIILSIAIFWTFPSPKILAMVLTSFVGIVLIVNPGLFGFSDNIQNKADLKKNPDLFYYLIANIAPIARATVIIYLKLYAKKIHFFYNAFYASFFCLLLSSFFCVLENPEPISFNNFLLSQLRGVLIMSYHILSAEG